MERLKVGVLGSGEVGQALGRGFATIGHDVTLGTREPDRQELQEWAKDVGKHACVGTFEEAARFGEILVLATNWQGTENALQLADHANLRDKILIDATNPLDHSTGVPRLAIAGNDSAGETVQRWLPETRVVKAFNIVGNGHMFRPKFPGGPPTMLIAGNDDNAKATVQGILLDWGWEVADLGGIENARYLEPIALAWTAYGMATDTWDHAFKLLRK